MEQWLILGVAMLATGTVAGVLAGLFGIGGGIVIVPVLETALGFVGVDPAIRMHIAVATSLATIIPTSISSARAHHQRGAVDVEIVKRWTIFVLLGALLGAQGKCRFVIGDDIFFPQRTQYLRPRPIGRRTTGLPRKTPTGRDRHCASLLRRNPGECAFADAGFAGN